MVKHVGRFRTPRDGTVIRKNGAGMGTAFKTETVTKKKRYLDCKYFKQIRNNDYITNTKVRLSSLFLSETEAIFLRFDKLFHKANFDKRRVFFNF